MTSTDTGGDTDVSSTEDSGTEDSGTEGHDRLGPVELLVIEFPRGVITSGGLATLTDLVDRGIIAVLDLEFVRRGESGAMEPVDIADAIADAPDDLTDLIGASSGLLDQDDMAAVGELIEPGSLAGVLLFEHLWIMPMIDAVEAGGARVVTAAHVDPADLIQSLDRLDADSTGASSPHDRTES